MHVLLVNPYQDTQPYLLPNLGLGCLATALREAGHRVTYLDCVRDGVDREAWPGWLAGRDVDVLGVQLFTYNWANVADLIASARRVLPAAALVCGGPHPNAAPAATLEGLAGLDYAVSGEGEAAIVALCDLLSDGPVEDAALKDVPNLVWRDAEGRTRVNPRWVEEELDRRRPAWDLMAPDTYPLLAHGILNRAWPIAPIFATRGCPYPCTFCSAADNMGRKIRVRTPERVVDEIAHLVRTYGVREIHIEDDNFTFNRRFAMGVCQEIIRRGLEIVWACPNGVRLDRLDAELLVAMARSGCYSMAVGIETGSDRILKAMRKQATVAENLAQLRLIRRHTDIQITGFFIHGYPGETLDTLAETRQFALEAPLDRLAISPFLPLPNTAVFHQLVAQGRIPAQPDWDVLSAYGDDTYQSFCEVPTEALLADMKDLSIRFWMRPRVVATLLREIHSAAQVKVSVDYVLYLSGLKKARYW